MVGIVLDTNILVSALLSRQGFEARALDLTLAGRAQLFISPPILAEYEDVLRRPRFQFTRASIDRLLRKLQDHSTLVHPKSRVTASADDDDNRFLECAETAGAHYLVTGNLKHLPASFRHTRTINARQFVELMIDVRRP